MKLNPLYNEERFKKYKIDKIYIQGNENEAELIKVKHAWGAKKLSKFVRCYV